MEDIVIMALGRNVQNLVAEEPKYGKDIAIIPNPDMGVAIVWTLVAQVNGGTVRLSHAHAIRNLDRGQNVQKVAPEEYKRDQGLATHQDGQEELVVRIWDPLPKHVLVKLKNVRLMEVGVHGRDGNLAQKHAGMVTKVSLVNATIL